MMTPGFIAIAVALCLLAMFYGAYAELYSKEIPINIPTKYEERLIAIDREAIEAAYRQHVYELFRTWMKDHSGQPERAIRGANQARKAYVDSMTATEQRERK